MQNLQDVPEIKRRKCNMLIKIDFEIDTPIYTQLRNQIVIGIASGELKPNEALPSVRRMSADIGIHAHTVNKSYAILRDEGYIVIDRRSGCHVAATLPKSDAGFIEAIKAKLAPIVAEVMCHGMQTEDFGRLCEAVLSEIAGQTRTDNIRSNGEARSDDKARKGGITYE